MTAVAEIAVIGGSGLYRSLSEGPSEARETPYGSPSDSITVAEVAGRQVAFLPRHGRGHSIPPHLINYRANLWALRELGVTRVVGTAAVGSLRRELAPGNLVICDQFVDRTQGRPDTYVDHGAVAHLSAPDPYCPELRPPAVAAGRDQGFEVHDGGTVVVIPGPRFSTRAESRWLAAAGWDVVGMTQYPEVVLARELGLCYLNLSLITDYDSGLADDPHARAVTQEEVLEVFDRNLERLRATLLDLLGRMPAGRSCRCSVRPLPLG